LNDLEAPWVGAYYDKYRSRYYQTIGDDEMSDLWAYEPEKCDGDICFNNCDHCPKSDPGYGKDDEDEEDV